ncbi:hypothetical protein SOM11_08040 [Frigoribacterium sp. CFBP9039]|uniref:hypothetical protein n=1 Tax=Frigoribacterium sp. CFBP9029 TaxID=3096541 RepID=UPI002A69DFBC|nr:hypothetical protein [Frigoribacterium sp. CFBP9039]MDY0945931.1 hypothetical protein [Frigoribacterium sp. CFBP9039]
MNTGKWARLAIVLLGAGALAGCSFATTDDVFAEEQISSDALPQVESVVLADLDPESARYLGEAKGSQFWAARNADGEFCVLAKVVAGGANEMISGCSPGDGDTLTISMNGGPSASWSAVENPTVPDGSTLLRAHLLVSLR